MTRNAAVNYVFNLFVVC